MIGSLKPPPINHFPFYILIELCKAVCLFANTSFVVANEEGEVEPKGIFDHGFDCFKFSLAEIMLVLQNKHSVSVLAVVVNEIECNRRFAVLVRLSVFVLFHYCGGKGLRRRNYLITINIPPFAEMIIRVAVASRNVFVVSCYLYVRKRLGDYLLIYCSKIDFGATWINDIEPNAVIWVDKLVNRLVVFILPGGKYSVLNQSTDILIAFVIGKPRELADVADAVVSECNRVADEHIAF